MKIMAVPRLRMKAAGNTEERVHPNHLLYEKMEALVRRMLDEKEGVPIKTVKSLLSKIPSVFTGADLIQWIMKNGLADDQIAALHFAHLLASHGYLFPIDDHMLTMKNDNTFYRFQTPYFWPSHCWEPENTDYAVYLCKRTMQNKAHSELEDFEAENLAKLQKMFSRKWEFIFMQAEAQYKVDKKRDRLERQILDSQERAFWDVHRPVPGCVNTTEVDFRKLSRSGKHRNVSAGKASVMRSQNPVEAIKLEIQILHQRLSKSVTKTSKIAECYITYYEQRLEFDSFLTHSDPGSPWIVDNTELWDYEKLTGEISARRVKRWGLSLEEMLSDSIGKDYFMKFLDKEYSGENLRFWDAVQDLKGCANKDVASKVSDIFEEFLGHQAAYPVNIDSKVSEQSRANMEQPSRWTFDEAAEHIYRLMKNDSYQRFLRSDAYRDLLNSARKKVSAGKVSALRSVISFPGKHNQPMIQVPVAP